MTTCLITVTLALGSSLGTLNGSVPENSLELHANRPSGYSDVAGSVTRPRVPLHT